MDSINITIQDIEEQIKYRIEIEAGMTIGELKEKIYAEQGIEKENQVWIINDNIADDRMQVKENGEVNREYYLIITDMIDVFAANTNNNYDRESLNSEDPLEASNLQEESIFLDFEELDRSLSQAPMLNNRSRVRLSTPPKREVLNNRSRVKSPSPPNRDQRRNTKLAKKTRNTSGWTCDYCTFQNKKGSTICQACSNTSENIINQYEEMTWFCQNCLYSNEMSKTKCDRCSTKFKNVNAREPHYQNESDSDGSISSIL